MAEPRFDPSTGYWYIRYHTAPGKRKKKPLGKHPGWKPGSQPPKKAPADIQLAARDYQDLDRLGKVGLAEPIPEGLPVTAFLADYTSFYASRRKETSQRTLAVTLKSFREFCAEKKVVDFKDVTPDACEKYLDWMNGLGSAYNSMKTERAILCAAWNWARKKKKIKENPWDDIEIPGEDDSEGTPAWTNSEVAKILGALDGWALDVFTVGINCGFRCQAIRKMTWGWIKWNPEGRRRGIVVCPKKWSKVGKDYSVPLFDPLHDVLVRRMNEAKSQDDDDLVFPGKCEDGGINASGFEHRLKRTCGKIGIEWRGHAWHGMRATFATRYLEMGYSPRAVQKWMCHSSLKMTDKYLKYADEAEDDELDRVEARMRAEAPNPPVGP